MICYVAFTWLTVQMAVCLYGWKNYSWGILGDKKEEYLFCSGQSRYTVWQILQMHLSLLLLLMRVMRFFSGVGLCGELGAAITLVSESYLKKQEDIELQLLLQLEFWFQLLLLRVGDFLPWNTGLYSLGVGCLD